MCHEEDPCWVPCEVGVATAPVGVEETVGVEDVVGAAHEEEVCADVEDTPDSGPEATGAAARSPLRHSERIKGVANNVAGPTAGGGDTSL